MDEVTANKHIPLLIPQPQRRQTPARVGPRSVRVHAPRARHRARRRDLPKRQAMIEPILGDVKFNRKIDQFHRRGRSAVRSKWRLITATIAVGTGLCF